MAVISRFFACLACQRFEDWAFARIQIDQVPSGAGSRPGW